MSGSVSGPPARSTRVAVTVVVAGGTWLLVRLGDVLGVPAGSAVDLQRLMEQSDPALLAAALLRLLGLAAGVYLGGVLALATVADLVRWRPLARMSVRLTPAVLRRWVVGGANIGLAGGVIVTPVPVGGTPLQRTAAPASQNPPANPDDMVEDDMVEGDMVEGDKVETTAVMVKLDDEGLDDAAVGDAGLGDVDDDSDAYVDRNLDEDDDAAPRAVAAGPPAAPEDAWVVMPGESFWSIAEEVLADRDRGASIHELTAFWARLIDANRDRLADPHNPDLLFPGQELMVPEP
jgi:hypothetical protein